MKTPKQDIWFISDGDIGSLAHSRNAAHQWLDNFLDRLKSEHRMWGEQSMVVFEYRAMTQKELERLPEA